MAAQTEDVQAEIARCDREISEIEHRPDIDTAPAYLITLGQEDWLHEKRLIQSRIGKKA